MAVYGQTYKSYEGELTPSWSRFLVIPRYAYQDLFKYTLFIVLYVICFIPPLVYAVIIYLRHNIAVLAIFNLSPSNIFQVGGLAFYVYLWIQTGLSFIFTVIIGPVLISRDLTNNGLPLYLCRPFSRFEYILGKASVLLILLSTITWVPGALLFLLESYLEGGGWLVSNLWILNAIFITSLVSITTLTLLGVAISAWVKWRTVASGAIFVILLIPLAIAVSVNEILKTSVGHLFSMGTAFTTIAGDLFRLEDTDPLLSFGEAWLTAIGYAVFCLFLLWRKVRAYEVVS